jgi:hypothetical protein
MGRRRNTNTAKVPEMNTLIRMRGGFRLILTLLLLIVSRGVSAQSLTSADESTPPVKDPLSAAGEGSTAAPGPSAYLSLAAQNQQLTDLTLGNFFSAGWDEDFAMRSRATGTPDLPLLRVQNNYLLRLARANFFEETGIASTTKKNLTDFDGWIDWGFNRRLQIEVNDTYQWIDPRTGSPTASGGAPGLAARVQLIDTESSALCFNFKAVAPNVPLGTTQTTLTYGLAGFEDLSYCLPLDRVGLYYSFAFDSYCGPAAATAKNTDIQYDISIAKTLTDPKAPIGMLTLFLENFAQTDIDDSEAGRTLVTITPGLRFNFGNVCQCAKMGLTNAVIFGTDIPVSEYRPWAAIYRLSYIKCF